MSSPVRTLNAATTQYIGVILILVCVFVMLSEEARSKIKHAASVPAPPFVQTEVLQANPTKKQVVFSESVSTKSLMQQGKFDDAVQQKIAAVMAMLGQHDLSAEFEISGRAVEISMVVNELQKFSLPVDASKFILKPLKQSEETTLAIRVVQPSKMRNVRAAV